MYYLNYCHMKRILLIIAFILIYIAAHAQQSIPNKFFGLKFDEAYTIDQMIEHIGSNGTFIQTVEPFQMGTAMYYGYVFEDVTYDAQPIYGWGIQTVCNYAILPNSNIQSIVQQRS